MTVFDVLVYTDAAANESLSGLTGFQFVAKSAGATATDEEVVHRRLQHLVPTGMRPEAWRSHPATCVFATEGGRMYLGRGASTGATLSGRPGNQLTQAIMTSDPYDVLPLRPAQLYSAPGWSMERPAMQEVAAWAPPLEISPEFDVPALHDLAAGNPSTCAALPVLLTMLEQTQGDPRVRLVIRHPDQSLVMRWVALLSCFLDAEAALRLEFRVYSENPLATNAHIVGAHPDLSPDVTVDRVSSGVNLVDLETLHHSPIVPSESARRHAHWFLTGDPYEALDAVEVSRRWSRMMAPDVAARAAELACLVSNRLTANTEELRTSTAALRALAQGGRSEELDAYGDALVDVVEGFQPAEAGNLLEVVDALWALSSAGKTELAQAVALFCLQWAMARPDAAATWANAQASAPGRLAWPDADARAHAASMLAAILSSADARDLPALFAMAHSLDTGVTVSEVTLAVDRLAAVWASSPTLSARARTWLHRDAAHVALRSHLSALLAGGDQAAVASLRDGAWDWLGPQPWAFRPDDPMSVWLAVRALPGADAATRERVLTAVLPHAHNSAWELYLSTRTGLDPKDVSAWIRTHRAIDPRLAERIESIVGDTLRHPAWHRGGAARVLHALGSAGVTGLPPVLHALVIDQARILDLFEQAKTVRSKVPNLALRSLAQSSTGSLTRIYSEWVVEAIVFSADVEGALALIQEPGKRSSIADRVAGALEQQLRAGEVAALVTSLRLLDSAHPEWSDVGKRVLDCVWRDRTVEAVRQQLVERLAASTERGMKAALLEYETNRGKGRFARVVDMVRSPSLFKTRKD